MRQSHHWFYLAASLIFCLTILPSQHDREQSGIIEHPSLLLSQTITTPPDTSRPLAKLSKLTPTIATPPHRVVSSAIPAIPAPLATRAPATPRERPAYREMLVLVTAYCPCQRCCGKDADGRTSTGTSAWEQGAATDPRVLPYGTRLYIEGYGEVLVDDTGGAMRQRYRRGKLPQIDLRMTYHWQARRWGRRYMSVRVYHPVGRVQE